MEDYSNFTTKFRVARSWSITLLRAVLLMLLLVRGGLVRFHQWVSSDLPPLRDRPVREAFWMTQVTRDSSRNFLGAEPVAVDLVNSDLVADNSLGGIQ